ncbi:hypothetical protein Huta_1720 [Halorhabdus utahensis DSM 12940]|uniref:Pentapeptide repeat protein n=1 Tax=Halorhabdus utahensis (strain DSM 12940 / JCM 11049 / AX-2) TaxID=519442 RepID=C7NQY9_HALUD|nr:hypothetical protein [Halorhabdus utahensis]ACV11893.1 hypothetical protein Huta_1720 [Halorhabdus utahensis DSM 12940]
MSSCTFSTGDLQAPDHSNSNVSFPKEWSCPHEAVEGREKCIFHLTSKERERDDISDEYVANQARKLATERTEKATLIGANLPELDLSDTIVSSESGGLLDLRFSSISGELNFNDTLVEIPVSAVGAELTGGIELRNTTFEKEVSFYGSRIKSTIEGMAVQFQGRAIFARILASYSVRLRDSTIFEKTATFSQLEIKGKQGSLDLRRVLAKGPFYGRQIDVPRFDCSETVFEGFFGLLGAHIRGDANFRDCHFKSLTTFGDGDRKQIPDNTEIEGSADFTSVLADQTLSFEKVKFKGELDFTGSFFARIVRLELVTLYDGVKLNQSKFKGGLEFKPQYTTSEGDYFTVTAAETSISSGILAQPGQAQSVPIRFEFVDANLGDVSFYETELEGEPFLLGNYTYKPSSLDHVKFVRTRFTGFDFTSYRTAFEGNWTLHRFTNANENRHQSDLDPVDLELTYMYGKQGANNIGDNLAAAKFFQKEMEYRTKRYHPATKNIYGNSWLKHAGLRLWGLTNFSESPTRVFSLGVLLTVGFAALYGILSFLGIANAPYSNAPLGTGYLIFSAESLITLVHAPGAIVKAWEIRLLSVFEGFLGAFLIALFVFSLTRAVHR